MKIKLFCLILALFFVGCGTSKEHTELTYTLSEDGSCYIATAVREDNLTTTTITVPKTYKDKPVVLSTQAFYGLPELEKVTVEGIDGIIPSYTFENCPKLKEVVLKGNAILEEKCFQSCLNLEKITFGDGIQEIGESCFVDCPMISTIVLGKDLTQIGAHAFSNCINLTEVTFPTEKELIIGDYAFEYCGITELKIPANVKLGKYSFGHLAWDASLGRAGASRCKAVYFYSTEPTKEYLGTNSIGFTWDRTSEDSKELGDFIVYVPEGYEEIYETLMIEECDESWDRCILKEGKLGTFDPQEHPYGE